MIFMIDNYDSFTYNLYQYLSELGEEVDVRRNDQVTLDEIDALRPEAIIISPGPGGPLDAGISLAAIERFGPRLPLLGVCLGHQCIGHAYGGVVQRAGEIMHGKTSLIYHDGRDVLKGLPSPFEAVRYHSLIVDRATLPACLEVTAQTSAGLIMALRHREYPMWGVQFHPESILTSVGMDILRNFLELARRPQEDGRRTMDDARWTMSDGGRRTQAVTSVLRPPSSV
ncbi:MAG: aminodeoxychorismate/anthranilate synthase component II [Chloroflexi bacterium]|nr:aminodeoxychorismate/anthranilate synthase component II [Chloroflexota bacterium]